MRSSAAARVCGDGLSFLMALASPFGAAVVDRARKSQSQNSSAQGATWEGRTVNVRCVQLGLLQVHTRTVAFRHRRLHVCMEDVCVCIPSE